MRSLTPVSAVGNVRRTAPSSVSRAGAPYVISQEHCLHCGLCCENCPVGAIERRGERDENDTGNVESACGADGLFRWTAAGAPADLPVGHRDRHCDRRIGRNPDQRVQSSAKPTLGVVNFLYTIPSISMLGFLIPFSGVGNATAVIALTVYALLPMVRNTHTGMIERRPGHSGGGQGHGKHPAAGTLEDQAAAGHAGDHVRHPQHGDHDHRPGRHRLFHRRRRPGRGDLPGHYHQQRRHDHGGQPADRPSGSGWWICPAGLCGAAHDKAQRQGEEDEPDAWVHRLGAAALCLPRRSALLPAAAAQETDPHRHKAHDRAVCARGDAGHSHRAGHGSERGADPGRGRRNFQYPACHGERRI